MKYYPRKGYEDHLNTYHTLAFGDEAARIAAMQNQRRQLCQSALPEGVSVETRAIPGPNPEQTLEIRVVRPENLPGSAPVILDIHGGAWIGGAADADDFRCALLASAVPCIVVSVNYRLAPKNPFPAALEDCHAAFVWLHAHAAELGGDPDRLGLHGTSAGGNLVGALSLFVRDHGGPHIALAALVNPSLGLKKTLSYYQIQKYPLGPDGGYAMLPEALYLGNLNGQMPSYYAFPALCPLLADFPKALIIASEYDQLRDDAIHFAQKLYDEGVPCELVVAPRVGHGFMSVDNALTRQITARMADSFRNEFGMI